MFVVLLFVVCCLLYDVFVRRSLFVVRCLLRVAVFLFVVNCALFVVVWFVAWCLLCDVCLMFVGCRVLFAVPRVVPGLCCLLRVV